VGDHDDRDAHHPQRVNTGVNAEQSTAGILKFLGSEIEKRETHLCLIGAFSKTW
jgi:hypothetical protein